MRRSLFAAIVVLLICGCRSAASLDRKPVKRAAPVGHARKEPDRKQTAERGGDPFFDAVFRRKPQRFDDNSTLSRKELELLHRNDVRLDPEVRKIHEKNRRDKSGKDWVFGTKNGSYF